MIRIKDVKKWASYESFAPVLKIDIELDWMKIIDHLSGLDENEREIVIGREIITQIKERGIQGISN